MAALMLNGEAHINRVARRIERVERNGRRKGVDPGRTERLTVRQNRVDLVDAQRTRAERIEIYVECAYAPTERLCCE